ncbi:MAG: B12-binding domain-containing radical SAM protein [Cytophagales bacterium]|nr:B12-binding domain-containing radical SAM protein [Cytophagales bacterium]
MKILSLIPPMTQLNTPYPSTAYLTGFLRSRGFDAVQEDLALALVLKLLSKEGIANIHGACRALLAGKPQRDWPSCLYSFLDQYARYASTIDAVIRFLQGGDSTLAHRIGARGFLPEGPRFDSLDNFADDQGADPLAWAFGALGAQDRARHIATLYLNDLADVIKHAIDSRFEFVRYAEKLAASQATFDPLANALVAPHNLVDSTLEQLTLAAIKRHQPALVLVSVPFPGAVYAAFRMAQTIKKNHPHIVLNLGGGFVNTELRELSDARVFHYFDYITLDAGERPLLALIEHLQGKRSAQRLVRTFQKVAGVVQYTNFIEPDIAFEDVGTPTWDGLPLGKYLSLLDLLNPMHRLWSDGRWNKLTVAHGCYWKKCSFCDVSLDYISRYDAASAQTLVNRVEAIVAETGQTGFHLVDEAAPPKSLKALSHELLQRNLSISWWGNVRFEKSFTPELCNLMADSGCIAISGGLEVASDRLLKLMKKGVSVAQVARVTKAFSEAGILVHAYLMYGFPTQTVQDTVDSLEYVRQLFLAGCIQSGYFHRFTCTVHSPVGLQPADYGITLQPLPAVASGHVFAKNDVQFDDPTGVDHDALGVALNKALYNYMHGIGLETNVRSWFEQRVPKTTVAKDFVEQALTQSIDRVVAVGEIAITQA